MVISRKLNLKEPVTSAMSQVQTTVCASQTIKDALDTLRSRMIDHRIMYIYVVDDEDVLVGVLPIRELILGDRERTVEKVMRTSVVRIRMDVDLEHALGMFASHRLLALPVVDDKGRLMGAIDVQVYADETFELAQTQRINDLFQVMGVSVEEARNSNVLRGYRKRLPWLLCNVIGGIGCAVIAWSFSMTLETWVALALFIPLVLTLAESISMQAMTFSLQLTHVPSVQWSTLLRRMRTEVIVAAMLGASCGVLVAIVSWLITGDHRIGIVLALSVCSAMISSSIAGGLVPVFLHQVRLDPRIAAGPLVLVLADLAATSVYLGLATGLLPAVVDATS